MLPAEVICFLTMQAGRFASERLYKIDYGENFVFLRVPRLYAVTLTLVFV